MTTWVYYSRLGYTEGSYDFIATRLAICVASYNYLATHIASYSVYAKNLPDLILAFKISTPLTRPSLVIAEINLQ